MSKIGRWMRDHPRMLERMYTLTHFVVEKAQPLIERFGYERADRLLRWSEERGKQLMFDCEMCGQCVLHSTGMTCPMSCPKNLRNGPCGGVRQNGHCEVKPEMKCIWVEAFERSQEMAVYGDEILHLQPPVNRQLEGSSAWVNMLTGEDKNVPEGWVGLSTIPVIES